MSNLQIEALADPTPPSFSDEDLQHDPRAEIERLIEQMCGRLSKSCSTRSIDGLLFICAGRAIGNGLRTQ